MASWPSRPEEAAGIAQPRSLAMDAFIKNVIVRAAIHGFLPIGFADWLIARLGLRST